MKLLSIFAALVFSLSALAKTYPMYCKGPLNVIALPYGQIRVMINKNAQKAINNGKNLNRGSCAWSDRPISSGEPSLLSIDSNSYSVEDAYVVPDIISNPAKAALLAKCISTNDCVFKVDVANNGNMFSNAPRTDNLWFFWNMKSSASVGTVITPKKP